MGDRRVRKGREGGMVTEAEVGVMQGPELRNVGSF